jgi:hypothetical protein
MSVHRAQGFAVIVVAEGQSTIDSQSNHSTPFVNPNGLELTGRSGLDQVFADRRQMETPILAQIGGPPAARPIRDVVVVDVPAMVLLKQAVPCLKRGCENAFSVQPSRAEEDDVQSLSAVFGPDAELEQEVGRAFSRKLAHQVIGLSLRAIGAFVAVEHQMAVRYSHPPTAF